MTHLETTEAFDEFITEGIHYMFRFQLNFGYMDWDDVIYLN